MQSNYPNPCLNCDKECCSARAAAKANHMSYQTVLDRCHGKVKKPFALDGYTYQFDK